MVDENTWYVMFGPRRSYRTPDRRSSQTIHHFDSEADARSFARIAIRNGHTVVAGTRPGLEPVTRVAAEQVRIWALDRDERDPRQGRASMAFTVSGDLDGRQELRWAATATEAAAIAAELKGLGVSPIQIKKDGLALEDAGALERMIAAEARQGSGYE